MTSGVLVDSNASIVNYAKCPKVKPDTGPPDTEPPFFIEMLTITV